MKRRIVFRLTSIEVGDVAGGMTGGTVIQTHLKLSAGVSPLVETKNVWPSGYAGVYFDGDVSKEFRIGQEFVLTTKGARP